MPLSREGKLGVWLLILAVFVFLLVELRTILLPFVVGMAIAYFLDPISRRLERAGVSRTLATVLITLGFFVLVGVLIVLLAPIVEDQVVRFAHRVPDYIAQLVQKGEPVWRTMQTYLSPQDVEKLRSAAGDYAGTMAGWLGAFFKRLVSGSLAVVNVLSLVFITPVVTFYLMRDWQGVTKRVNSWLPREYAPTIRQQLHEIDLILSGFVRGQAMVCLSLGAFYGIALTAVGLDLGLVVGFGAGMVSFIPYLGSISGFIIGVGLAFAQTQGWTLPAMVAGVFIAGNLLEGNVLSPKLVGEKIGLHPVWVIFALLAGSALFGFLGLLLALPVAAVTGVLCRFGLSRYLASSLYGGDQPDA
jgi:predicted PurR-regulated permease PerM